MVKGKLIQKPDEGVKREPGRFYFLDKKLNIRMVKRKTNGKSNGKKSNKEKD